MSFALTIDDWFLLEKYRLERLRNCFEETLSLCVLQLDTENTLLIHCSEPWLVDHLMQDIDQLCWYSWLVVGAQQLSICFVQEEIISVETREALSPVA